MDFKFSRETLNINTGQDANDYSASQDTTTYVPEYQENNYGINYTNIREEARELQWTRTASVQGQLQHLLDVEAIDLWKVNESTLAVE